MNALSFSIGQGISAKLHFFLGYLSDGEPANHPVYTV
jgi:hypothetical protein